MIKVQHIKDPLLIEALKSAPEMKKIVDSIDRHERFKAYFPYKCCIACGSESHAIDDDIRGCIGREPHEGGFVGSMIMLFVSGLPFLMIAIMLFGNL